MWFLDLFRHQGSTYSRLSNFFRSIKIHSSLISDCAGRYDAKTVKGFAISTVRRAVDLLNASQETNGNTEGPRRRF